MWHIGIFVLILHDYTDFALILARAYKDFKHKINFILQIIYVHAVSSWIAMRLFIFSACCVLVSIKSVIYFVKMDFP